MSVRDWKLLAALAAVLAGGLTGSAQEGIVRIADGPASGVQTAGHKRHVASFDDCPDCQPRKMKAQRCPKCYGHGCDHCKHHCWGSCCLGKFREHYCTNSPDHGFSIPAKYPVYRRGVEYNAYFPNQWLGADGTSNFPGSGATYPMVYMPTDTTQLGFYHQHVPFWQPNPNMLPPRPHPAQWHNSAPSPTASRFHHGWNWGYGPLTGGSWGADFQLCDENGVPLQNQPAPAVNPSTTQPAPLPSQTPPPAPVPVQESAANLPVQRAGF
jgi:hypothetical protein